MQIVGNIFLCILHRFVICVHTLEAAFKNCEVQIPISIYTNRKSLQCRGLVCGPISALSLRILIHCLLCMGIPPLCLHVIFSAVGWEMLFDSSMLDIVCFLDEQWSSKRRYCLFTTFCSLMGAPLGCETWKLKRGLARNHVSHFQGKLSLYVIYWMRDGGCFWVHLFCSI